VREESGIEMSLTRVHVRIEPKQFEADAYRLALKRGIVEQVPQGAGVSFVSTLTRGKRR
jgi:hypothetical protein